MLTASTAGMEIIDKAKSIGAAAVDKVKEKREALTETVSDLIQRGKDAAHHVVDKVTAVVEGNEAHEASEPAPAQARVTKQRGKKKPRAARRRARRDARMRA